MGFFGPLKPLHRTEADGKALAKTLSWPHLMALGIGGIIGTGIYTLTGVGAGLAGPGVILSFALCGLVCACAALCYTEMSTMIPAAGSAYTYTYSAIGEIAGWVVGWALILEYSLACSSVAVGWSAHLVGWLRDGIGLELPAMLLNGPHAGGLVNLPAVVVSLAVMGLLLIGARESATINIVLVIIKIVALGAFIVLGLPAIQSGNYDPFAPYGFIGQEIGGEKVGIMAAAAIVFFAFFGFDAVSTSAEEAKKPGRDLTIGILGSMAVSTVIYMLVAAVAVGVAPFREIANSGEPLPHILREIGYPIVAAAVGMAAIIALPSVILVMMYGQSRIFFVMARDGLLPQAVAKVNAKGSPALITLLTGVFVAVFAGFVPLKEIAALSNAGTLIAFVAVALSVIILRVRMPNAERVFKTPVYWLIAPAAIAGCVFIFWNLPRQSQMFTLVWMVIGLVFYFAYGFWNSRLRKEKAE
ncbi:amino acid permease [Asticcacaulis sp. AC460]|uniref:amino acid permease n=1 Tax=Asticcacaulis sp. AC460 TaxID=1282360 RepID=UPI0003C3E25C|nr:amino acid permease [Asticcacaulis sp. AC460]ESQ91353.1 amino acid permease [Asticcacaulis sp. AC460]